MSVLTAWVRGRVQGVGFRWFTRANALEIGGLVGFALNLGDGRVQVVAEGPTEHASGCWSGCATGDTPGRVDGVTEIWGTPRGGYDGLRDPLSELGRACTDGPARHASPDASLQHAYRRYGLVVANSADPCKAAATRMISTPRGLRVGAAHSRRASQVPDVGL